VILAQDSGVKKGVSLCSIRYSETVQEGVSYSGAFKGSGVWLFSGEARTIRIRREGSMKHIQIVSYPLIKS